MQDSTTTTAASLPATTLPVLPTTTMFHADTCRDDRPTVLVVGDSVLQGARSVLHAPLEDRFDVTYDALRDRPTPVAADIVADTPAGEREVLVVGVGYNDEFGDDGYEDRAAELLENAEGSELILWLTLSDARSRYAEVNDVLDDLTRTHPELELVAWGSRADEVDGYTVGDGIHLSGEGAEALTELVLSHLDDWLAMVPECATGDN